MALEIERKFIARAGELPPAQASARLSQGDIDRQRATVRVRLSGDSCWLTIKGPTTGASRPEFEFSIPPHEGKALLEALGSRPLVEKTRHRIPHAGHTWEVDVFHGDNEGLVIAEVELDDEDEVVALPPWVGREVTGEHRYANSALARHPYREWTAQEQAEG